MMTEVSSTTSVLPPSWRDAPQLIELRAKRQALAGELEAARLTDGRHRARYGGTSTGNRYLLEDGDRIAAIECSIEAIDLAIRSLAAELASAQAAALARLVPSAMRRFRRALVELIEANAEAAPLADSARRDFDCSLDGPVAASTIGVVPAALSARTIGELRSLARFLSRQPGLSGDAEAISE